MSLRGVLFSSLLCGLALTASAQSQSQPATPVPTPSLAVPSLTPGAPPVVSKPVFVPDYSRSGEGLPAGIIVFDSLMKGTDVLSGADFAHFYFTFTNVFTNPVTILGVHPSCGCTTAELPPVPWTIAPGKSGEIKLNVNLAGKFGTVFKSASVTTDKGRKDLMMRINIMPPKPVQLTDAQMQEGILAAKADRQRVFKGECATCHAKDVSNIYGQQLYVSVCSICHDARNRATMVPDLSKLKVPTDREFWRTWVTYGKPGSLMPAFANSQGGPLTDMQIVSLAAYLSAAYPSHVPRPQ